MHKRQDATELTSGFQHQLSQSVVVHVRPLKIVFYFPSDPQISRDDTPIIQSVRGYKGASLGESGLKLKHLQLMMKGVICSHLRACLCPKLICMKLFVNMKSCRVLVKATEALKM